MYTGEQETVNSNQSISGLFNQQGFIGPFDLLDEETIDPFYKRCLGHIPNYLLSNVLFRHAAVRSMAEFAANPAFIQQIIPLLGPDILLWGSQLICQKPKKKKRFHVDAEFSTIDGVAVWLGLRNVVPEKTLFLISGSHRIAASPQEIAEHRSLDLSDGVAIEKAARELNPDSRLIALDIKDGQYVIFHGRLWHGASNSTSQSRYALNFRYAKPDKVVRISKDGNLPVANWSNQKPPCILINGQDNFGKNKLIDPRSINMARSLLNGYCLQLPGNAIQKTLDKLRKLRTGV
jgi:hypothetical protein